MTGLDYKEGGLDPGEVSSLTHWLDHMILFAGFGWPLMFATELRVTWQPCARIDNLTDRGRQLLEVRKGRAHCQPTVRGQHKEEDMKDGKLSEGSALIPQLHPVSGCLS